MPNMENCNVNTEPQLINENNKISSFGNFVQHTSFEDNHLNGIITTSFSSEKYVVGQSVNISSVKQYLLIFVTSGEVLVKINKANYLLSEKDSMLIFPNESFSITASKIDARVITISFYGENAEEIVSKTQFTRSNPLFHFSDEIFNLLTSCIGLTDCNDFFVLSLLYLIFAHTRNDNNGDKNGSRSLDLLNKVKKYINDNLDKELQISELAKQFNISRTYLYKIFVAHLNITPKDYIINKKMRRAYRLVKKNDIPIYVIAEQLGYKDQFVFSKAFKKMYRMSPREVAAGKIPYISVIDDEKGECCWPAQISSERHYKGNSALLSKPYYNAERNCIEGWIIRAGYFSSAVLPRSLDISTLTDYGKKGALSFMIFVERQCDVTNWCIDESDWIRFGSSTDWDTDFQYWIGWHKQIVKEGWNRIVLPFGKSEWGNVCGEPDYTDFKSFSIILSIPKHCRCFIDDIKVIRDF